MDSASSIGHCSFVCCCNVAQVSWQLLLLLLLLLL
jgi:hypothetical protein